jgi:hypothetical protein
LMKALAKSATARKIVRHPSPSFRSPAMTGQTAGEPSPAQGGKRYWLGSCFLTGHE